MEGSIEFSTLLAVAGAVSAIGGAWLTVRKVTKDLKKERELEAAKILQEAKEADAKMKAQMETARVKEIGEINTKIGEINAKITALEARIDNIEDSVTKDFSHIRETFNGEIRNLGEKIEDLRADLNSQHGQLVALLTKMIDKD